MRVSDQVELFAIPGAARIIRCFRDGEEWVLVQERDKTGALGETGLIEIPAGKVRAFENIYDCLRREIKEETGYDVTCIQGEAEAVKIAIIGYDVLSYTPFASSQNLAGTYPIMVQVFICEVEGCRVERSDESRNIRWMRLLELKAFLEAVPARFYPMHITTLRKYFSASSI